MGIEIRSPQTTEEWNAYYALRYEVLRKPLGQPVGSERNEGDAEAVHFALYRDGKLCAVARLDDVNASESQTRFVAVDPQLQGQGIGALIMEALESAARKRGKQKMILHARDYALLFYKKLGYTLIGESHKLFGVLQHYLMEKEL